MLFLFLLITLFFMLLMLKSYDNNIMLYEGMTNESDTSGNGSANIGYQNYDSNNNAYILAQKNAANIQYLKERVEKNSDCEKEIENLTNSVNLNSSSIKQVSKIMTQEMSKMTGVSPSQAKNFASGNYKMSSSAPLPKTSSSSSSKK